MRKSLFIGAALAAVAFAVPAIAAPFRVIFASNETSITLVDLNVNTYGGTKRTWVHMVFAPDASSGSVPAISALHEYDCAARKQRSLAMVSRNAKGVVDEAFDDVSKWTYPSPDSLADGMMDTACGWDVSTSNNTTNAPNQTVEELIRTTREFLVGESSNRGFNER